MTISSALKFIKDNNANFVDLRFTDTKGKEQHISYPADTVDESLFETGKLFDGSSIEEWKSINESDMILLPDPSTVVLDPFTEDITVNIRCDIIEPTDMQGYSRDPRSIAKRAENYLRSTGIADDAYFGPENEFFVFDSVRWGTKQGGAFYEIESLEAAWNSAKEYEEGNMGHRPRVKGGYFPVPPVDSLNDLRAQMCTTMKSMGLSVEVHHHEVGTAGQCEIGTRFDTLVKKADDVQIYKYVVHNVSHQKGKTATFMPKPFIDDNGSGMHVHQSLFKEGENIFAGDQYADLSENALYYIGGIFKHAHAINSFTNASTNSYKRLVPGFEAPVFLAYSARNRSVSCRIPYEPSSKGRRIEIRFPDNTANPYLAFTAMLMAGIDGIKNKIHPGEPIDSDLYHVSHEREAKLPKIAHRFGEALRALDKDRDFLLAGDVFSNDAIDAYIRLKMEDVNRLRTAANPVEFDMYYSI
ncbi:MAG: type I glutamate--ammonia ligase [Arenicellales bacterium WSBS_2016_MAG_OTU3]